MIPSVSPRWRRLVGAWLDWVVPLSDPPGTDGWWRGRMLSAMLLAYGAFGAILVVPNVQIARRVGVPLVVVIDVLVYALLAAVVLARRAPRALRAWVVVLATWGLGAFFSWGWAGNAAGPLWLLATPIIAAVLFGVREAVTMLALVAATTITLGVLASQGAVPWSNTLVPVVSPAVAVDVWLIIGSNLLFLAILGALGSAILSQGLADQAEARRRAEEELIVIGRALEQSENLVLLVNRDGTVTHRNDAGPAITREREGTVDTIGLTVVGDATSSLPWRAAFDGASWIGRCTRDDGDQQHFDVSITPVKDAAGEITRALLVVRDVTHQHTLEERLRTSAKLEAVGTLVGGIAHDFNNLLQPILANAEEIRLQLPAEHPAVSRAADISASATRGRALVRRILTFAQGVEMPRVPTALADVCEEAVRLTELLRTPALRLDLALAREAFVLADPAELHHVLVNLISNACHAMPEGGTLRIATRIEHDTVVLIVTDNGTGMDDTTRARVFTPFFSTKGPGRGTGLGLATVHGTVTSLGGTIDVASLVGRGTTMTIRLPAITAPELLTDLPSAQRQASTTPVHTVLLVDDDDAVRRAVTRMLTRTGVQVVDVGDPFAAVALIEQEARSFDVLLTDLSMPGLNGDALAARALALRPGLRVVLMTGIVESAHADAARAEGVTCVLQKPFSQEELRSALDLALAAPAS